MISLPFWGQVFVVQIGRKIMKNRLVMHLVHSVGTQRLFGDRQFVPTTHQVT